MALRSLLVGSVLALSGARALLVVPEVETDVTAFTGDIASILPLEAQAAQEQELELHCPECPFAADSGDETILPLKFSIEDDVLYANGGQIFPPAPPSSITAVQRHQDDGEESEPVPLGYAFEIMPLPSPPQEALEMVAVRFTVLDLDGYPVPLDTIVIHLIHNEDFNLYMAKVDIEKSADRQSWEKCDGKAKCLRRFMVHRIQSLFSAAKERFMSMIKGSGCGDSASLPFPPRPHHGESDYHRFPFSNPGGPEMSWGDEQPGRHHHHHPPHHHFHDAYRGNWHRTAHRIVRFIVVPAVLGVLAGLAASALGMLVGQVVVFLWQRRRRSERPESPEQGSVDEKQRLMTETNDDYPPAYYDEAPVEEVASKN